MVPLDEWLSPDPSQPPPAAPHVAAPLPDDQALADGTVGSPPTGPLTPETAGLDAVAAVRPGDDQANDGGDAAFAPLGDADGSLDLPGGDAGAAAE
jgi:hypothetical protein